MAKKVWRKPHITNRKCGANTQKKTRKHRFFFLFLLAEQKKNPAIDLHSKQSYSTQLSVPLLMTSAEMHNVVALKEEPKSLVRCAVAWKALWPQSKVSYNNLPKNTLQWHTKTYTTLFVTCGKGRHLRKKKRKKACENTHGVISVKWSYSSIVILLCNVQDCKIWNAAF